MNPRIRPVFRGGGFSAPPSRSTHPVKPTPLHIIHHEPKLDILTAFGGGFFAMAVGTGALQTATVFSFAPAQPIRVYGWRLRFWVSGNAAAETPSSGLGYSLRFGRSSITATDLTTSATVIDNGFWDAVLGMPGETVEVKQFLAPTYRRAERDSPIVAEIQYVRTNTAAVIASGFKAEVAMFYMPISTSQRAPYRA